MSDRTERRPETIDPYDALVLAALLSVSLAPMILLGAPPPSAGLVGATSLFSLTLAAAGYVRRTRRTRRQRTHRRTR